MAAAGVDDANIREQINNILICIPILFSGVGKGTIYNDNEKKDAIKYFLHFKDNFPVIYNTFRDDYNRVITSSKIIDYNSSSRLAKFFILLHIFYANYFTDENKDKFEDIDGVFKPVDFRNFINFPAINTDTVQQLRAILPPNPSPEEFAEKYIQSWDEGENLKNTLNYILDLEEKYSKQKNDAINILAYLAKQKKILLNPRGPHIHKLNEFLKSRTAPQSWGNYFKSKIPYISSSNVPTNKELEGTFTNLEGISEYAAATATGTPLPTRPLGHRTRENQPAAGAGPRSTSKIGGRRNGGYKKTQRRYK